MENQRQNLEVVRPTGERHGPEINGLAQGETHSPIKQNQEVTSEAVSLSEAAEWLSVHRDECVGAIIPFVRKRFGLKPADAIEALKRAHALRYVRAL